MKGKPSGPRRAVVAHVQTWRPYTLCYPALVGAAGAGVAGAHSAGVFAAAAGGPALGWLAGHYLGDYFDRDLDAIAKPQRPIPSGRLSARTALICGIGCAAGSAAVVITANWRALLLFVLAMAGIVAYSRICKGRGISGNLVRGAITTLAFLIGGMMAAPLPPWPVVVLSVIFLVHDTCSNLVGAVRDANGDGAGGYRSVPASKGVPYAVRLSLLLYGIAVGLAALGALVVAHPGAYGALLVVAAALGCSGIVPLLWVSPGLIQVHALRAHQLLVVERLVLCCAVLAGGVPLPAALLVLAPVVLFSGLTQAAMRARHELPPANRATTDRKAYQL
ncbi:MAG TPA: UbiA family prenyltransferase [Pseudonocardiaceae bacterium]|jgi:4-hydroxybenzoate polyprenyltransferase/geranylgeranylglycerol-phosphate geranylgeranyltransferase|nr:UbiA family prenyltransferase [Pseudonocardiaceae bacterium]